MPGKNVITPIDPDSLTSAMKKGALEAINLIKVKRDSSLKGRTCANGSQQNRYLKEYESTSSPTLSVEALLLTLVVYSYENREVATFDVPGTYLHALMPDGKTILLKMRGIFVDIMCNINKEYKKT